MAILISEQSERQRHIKIAVVSALALTNDLYSCDITEVLFNYCLRFKIHDLPLFLQSLIDSYLLACLWLAIAVVVVASRENWQKEDKNESNLHLYRHKY